MIYVLNNPSGMKLETNDDYMNKTENKDKRKPGEKYLVHVWHETATKNHPPVAQSTLAWNIPASTQSSYDILIAWDGMVYRYVDWKVWNSWAEGVSHCTVDGILYTSSGTSTTPPLGRIALSTEIDGMNNGNKASPAQIESAAKVRMMLEETESIPIDGRHDFYHYQIAPGRKTDPRAYTMREVFDEVNRLRSLSPNWPLRWGTFAHYDPTYGIPTAWRRAWEQGSPLGHAISHEYIHPENPDFVRQDFDFGVINWTPTKTYVSGPITLK